MAIVRVSAHDGIGSSSATFGGTPTSGNLLLCAVFAGVSTPATVTGWTAIADEALTPSVGSRHLTLLARTADGTEGTITPGGGSVLNTSVCEYSGASITQDGTANVSTSGGSTVTTLVTGAITTANAGSLIFTFGTGLGLTTGLSWTTATAILANPEPGAETLCGQYLPGTTTTNYTDTLHSTTAARASTIIAGFTPGGGPVATPVYTRYSNQAVMRSAGW